MAAPHGCGHSWQANRLFKPVICSSSTTSTHGGYALRPQLPVHRRSGPHVEDDGPRPSGRAPLIRILGPLEAWMDDRQLQLGGPRQVGLLACLAVHANQAVSVDQLTDLVWGEQRADTSKRLQMAIVRVRQALRPAVNRGRVSLTTVHGGYVLAVDEAEIDAGMFRTLVERGQRALHLGQAADARRALVGALDLWRGAPLVDVAYHDFAQPLIRQLTELHLTALEARIEADLRLGRHRTVVGELAGLLALHPARESVAGQLMRALYRCGRQGDALGVYQQVWTHLAADLGLTPSPLLTNLQRQILEQDPELEAERAALAA